MSEPTTDTPKLSSVMIAAAILECEALLALARAKFLQQDLQGFIVRVLEARCKLEALDDEIRQTKTEYFVAAPEAEPQR